MHLNFVLSSSPHRFQEFASSRHWFNKIRLKLTVEITKSKSSNPSSVLHVVTAVLPPPVCSSSGFCLTHTLAPTNKSAEKSRTDVAMMTDARWCVSSAETRGGRCPGGAALGVIDIMDKFAVRSRRGSRARGRTTSLAGQRWLLQQFNNAEQLAHPLHHPVGITSVSQARTRQIERQLIVPASLQDLII